MSIEPPIQLFYDKFMSGLLPLDNSRIEKDTVFNGSDGTVITVKQNSNTTYKELPRKVFEVVPDGTIVFQFVFPVGTLANPTKTQYTTPENSIYTFSSSIGDGVNNNNQFIKNVTEGTIRIRPPDEQSKIIEESTTFVNNAVIQESLLGDSVMGDLKDNPFYNVFLILYQVIMDMLVMVVFWLVFLSISCWLLVPSKYLYPTDIYKYPYMYFREQGDDYYNYTTPKKDSLCEVMHKATVKNLKEKQTNWVAELKEFETNNAAKAEILKVIYPEMLDCEEKNVNFFSKQLIASCDENSQSSFGYFMYLLKTLVFQNILYCTSVTSSLHSIFSVISNDILGQLGVHFVMVLFAVFLYFVFLGSGDTKKTVMTIFEIKIPEGKEPQAEMLNKFLHLLVYFLTAAMSLFIPLFSILLLICLFATIFRLGSNLIFPINFTTWVASFLFIMSLFTVMATTIGSLQGLLKGESTLKQFLEGLTKELTKPDINPINAILAIFSIFSIGIPLGCAFGYAGYIAVNIVVSAFRFLNLSAASTMIQNTIGSLVILTLLSLVMRVNERLGTNYMVITILIIVVMGAVAGTKSEAFKEFVGKMSFPK